MPFAALNGLSLYYELRGRGPRLLYLTGTGADLRRPPNPFERLLAQDFQAAMLEQRGMGRSAKPDVPYTMADYAADAAALLEHLGWERVPLLGYSFGGMVAQELALRQPQKLERLVLMSTTSGGAGGASYPLHELAGLEAGLRARRMVELADSRRDAQWIARNAAHYAALVQEALAAILFARDEPGHAEGEARQLGARRGHDTWERLPQLALPVTVCAGEFDGIAPPAHQAGLAARIPGARLLRFGGGHMFFLQDAGAYGAIRDALLGL